MKMQFTIYITSLLCLTTAAAITERPPIKSSGYIAGELVERQDDACGPLQTPFCCQLDVDGVANLWCELAGQVATTEEFKATCAETGHTAECYVLAAGADGLLCTAA